MHTHVTTAGFRRWSERLNFTPPPSSEECVGSTPPCVPCLSGVPVTQLPHPTTKQTEELTFIKGKKGKKREKSRRMLSHHKDATMNAYMHRTIDFFFYSQKMSPFKYFSSVSL